MKTAIATSLFICSLYLIKAQQPDSVLGARKFDEGMIQYKSGKYHQAIKLFTSATELFGEQHAAGTARSLEWIGYAHLRLSDSNKMIEFFKKAEPYARAALERSNDYKPLINNQLMLAMMIRSLNDGKEALVYYKNLEELILESEPNPMYMSLIYQHRAHIAQRNRNLKVVPGYLEKALAFAEQSGNRRQVIEVIESGQRYFYELGNFNKARQLSDELIDLATLEYGVNGSDLARYFTERARLDYVRQELEMAMNWVDRALELGTSDITQYYKDFGYTYYIKANLLLNSKSFEEAIEYYDQALDELNDELIHQDLAVATLDGKLTCFSYLGKSESIRSAIKQIQAQLSKGKVTRLTEANALLAIAFGYSALQQYDIATTHLDRVIEMIDLEDKGTSVPLYAALFEYSKMELERGNIQKALKLIDQAIAANTREVNGETYFISAQSNAELLVHKAEVLTEANRKNEALNVLNEGFDRIQSDRAALVGSEYSIESIQLLRNPALDLSYQLFKETGDNEYLETAFSIGELAKSQQLIQWITESVNSKSGTLDSALFAQRGTLVNDIGTLERLIVKEDCSSVASQYADSLFSLKRTLYDISLQIKAKHPEFYAVTYEKMNADLQSTLNGLETDEQLLSYFLTENGAYLMVLGSEVDFIKIEKDGLKEDIESFRDMLMNPSKNEFQSISKKIRQRVLPSDQLELAQKLIIITDGMLAYLPFELLSANGERYLMEKHDITYNYSVNALNSLRTNKSKTGFIAFAPNFKNVSSALEVDVVRSELAMLPGAIKEAKTVTEIHRGQVFTDSLATETNFRKHAEDAGLIHLATHAIVDDAMPNQSRLVFNLSADTINDGYLHAYEIFNFSLNAELVTLSACNTGFGKIKKGEGVMSLSRAFAYAGVPATVVSLWPASDKSTPELMKYFYENLKEGQTKDVALNNARKQYLETATGKSRHPFYWGGFVLIGDSSPIESENRLLVWILSITIIITLIIVIYRKSKYSA